MQTTNPNVKPVDAILAAAEALIAEAAAHGVVLTIQAVPAEPLAMGNYRMVASTRMRQERHMPSVIRD